MSARPAELGAAPPQSGRLLRRHGLGQVAPSGPGRRGLRSAQAACGVGMAFAAVSLYWALGGMWLVATVSPSLEAQAKAGDIGPTLLAWVAVVLKVTASVLPLVALHRLARPLWSRSAWVLASLAGGVLTLYGFLSTAGNLLALLGAFPGSDDAGHETMAWHAFLWDPWFLIWGVLACVALRTGRRRTGTGLR